MYSDVKMILPILVLIVIAGCSAESYVRSADQQVRQILHERKEQTLGYQPQTEIPSAIPPKPQNDAFARVPTTPVPPPTEPPIKPQRVLLPAAPLGPELRWKQAGPVRLDELGMELLKQRAVIDLRLGPPTLESFERQFDLFECLHYAVQNSREYQDQLEELYLSALDVTLERHLFDLRPFAQQRLDWDGGQRDVDYRSALTASNVIGVRQRLPWGGEIVAENLVSLVRALNGNVVEGEPASIALRGTMPLLRGFGMVNLEGLISSERQLVYQVRQFEDYRRSFVVSIAGRYFQLLAQQQGLNNRRMNLTNLSMLTERTQALYDAGRLSFLEVQRSLQSQLQAQTQLIDAEEAYQRALDEFKLVLGMPVDERLDVTPVELEVNLPNTEIEQAVDLAHAYRLDLKTAADQVEDAQRGISNARNALLPALDVNALGQIGNGDDNPVFSFDRGTASYAAGILLDLPVDRVAERNLLRRAIIAFDRAQRNYVEVNDRITIQVHDAIRGIRAARVNLEIQRRGIELAKRRLEFSSELLKQGKVNARDVVEAQSSLLDAQDRFERAKSALQTRVLEYMRDTGTLRVDPEAGAIGRAMLRQQTVSLDADYAE